MRQIPVLVVLALAGVPVAAQGPCPSPAPPAGIDPTSLQDRARLLTYARALAFHPAQAPTGETRALTSIATPGDRAQRRFRLAADASTQPQACAHRNTIADLRAGAGRIVARMTLDAAYDKLNLPGGTSYLWVDNLDGASARGVIVPDDASTPSRIVRIRTEFHPDLPERAFAESRWLFDPDDDEMWTSCVIKGCCVILGGG